MSNFEDLNKKLEIVETPESQETQEKPSTSNMSGERPKRAGRRPGRRSSKMDVRAKLERSRQSARECRARKKMRYQYLEDLVANREKAVFALREELELYKQWCTDVDKGQLPIGLLKLAVEEEKKLQRLKEPDYINISGDEDEKSDSGDEIVGGEDEKSQKKLLDLISELKDHLANVGARGSSVDIVTEPGSRSSVIDKNEEGRDSERRTVSEMGLLESKINTQDMEDDDVDIEGGVDGLIMELSESAIKIDERESESRSGHGVLPHSEGGYLHRGSRVSEKGSVKSDAYGNVMKRVKLDESRVGENQNKGGNSCLPTILEEFED